MSSFYKYCPDCGQDKRYFAEYYENSICLQCARLAFDQANYYLNFGKQVLYVDRAPTVKGIKYSSINNPDKIAYIDINQDNVLIRFYKSEFDESACYEKSFDMSTTALDKAERFAYLWCLLANIDSSVVSPNDDIENCFVCGKQYDSRGNCPNDCMLDL